MNDGGITPQRFGASDGSNEEAVPGSVPPRRDVVALGIDGITDATEIGRGGFGVVYRCTEVEFGRTVAIKRLFGDFDDQSRVRFERERLALGSLSGHPHIVNVHRSGITADGAPYLVMEFVPGGSMADRLIERGVLPWPEAAKVGIEIASALSLAHQHRVLHRDIKPGNILVAADGSTKLADFGIARLHGAPETQSAVITASIAHAPPEIVAGRRPDERSDIYSLASAVFEMVYGQPAFVGADEGSLVPMLARIAQADPPDLRPVASPAFVDALERGLAKAPEDRWPSAADFEQALRSALGADTAAAGSSLGQQTMVVSHAVLPPVPNGPKADVPVVGSPTYQALAPEVTPKRSWYRRFSLALWVWVLVVGGGLALVQAVTGWGESPEVTDLDERIEALGDLPQVTEPDLEILTTSSTTAPPTTAPPTTAATTTAPPTTAAPTTAAPTTAPPTTAALLVRNLVDTTGALSVSVDDSWSESRSDVGTLAVAPDLVAFDRGDFVEGVFLSAGVDAAPIDIADYLLSAPQNDICSLTDWNVTDDGEFQRGFAELSNCGGSGLNVLLSVSFLPADGSFLVRNLQYFGELSKPEIQLIIDTTFFDQDAF